MAINYRPKFILSYRIGKSLNAKQVLTQSRKMFKNNSLCFDPLGYILVGFYFEVLLNRE